MAAVRSVTGPRTDCARCVLARGILLQLERAHAGDETRDAVGLVGDAGRARRGGRLRRCRRRREPRRKRGRAIRYSSDRCARPRGNRRRPRRRRAGSRHGARRDNCRRSKRATGRAVNFCASSAQGRVKKPADRTAMAATRRYVIETVTNFSIRRAGESRNGPAEPSGSRMAFLVWSRKDGRNRRITPEHSEAALGRYRDALSQKPHSPHQVPTYWDNSARRRLPAEPR